MSQAKPIDLELLTAAEEGDLAKVNALLTAGADPNVRNESGSTPLHYATAYGYVEIVESLLAAKADPNAKGPLNDRPAHNASQNGDEVIMALLLAAKAELNGINAFSQTPMSNAVTYNHAGIVAMMSDDFASQLADHIPDSQVSRILRSFPPGLEDTTLQSFYAKARKSMTDDQRKEAFPQELGEALLAMFMDTIGDYQRVTDPDERRRHALTACACGTFPILLNDCVKSDAKAGSRKRIEEVVSYLTPRWQEQYREVIQVSEATLARTSRLPDDANAMLGFLRQ